MTTPLQMRALLGSKVALPALAGVISATAPLAAEMAAEEAGVAVYQIETIPGGRGDLGEVSVRFRDAAAG